MSKSRRKKENLAHSMASVYHDACTAARVMGDVDLLIYALKHRYGMDVTQLEAAKETLRATSKQLHEQANKVRDELLGPVKVKTT
jgi:Fe-S oxidoreductase